MKKQSVVFSISGQEGSFNVEKNLTMFWQHTSQESFKEDIAEVMKECRKLAKTKQVMLDVTIVENYDHISYYRFIIPALWNGFELDARKYRQNEGFLRNNVLTFTSANELFKYLKKYVSEISTQIIGEVPENDSHYGMYIKNKELFAGSNPEMAALLAD